MLVRDRPDPQLGQGVGREGDDDAQDDRRGAEELHDRDDEVDGIADGLPDGGVDGHFDAAGPVERRSRPQPRSAWAIRVVNGTHQMTTDE